MTLLTSNEQLALTLARQGFSAEAICEKLMDQRVPEFEATDLAGGRAPPSAGH